MSYTKTTNFAIKDTYLTGNPAKVIKGAEIDTEFNNLAAADALNLKVDGSSAATADIPMGGYKLTGLDDGIARSDSTRVGQVQDSAVATVGSISGVDTITGALSPAITAYAAGQTFRFVSVGANTGAVTININGVGAKSITKNGAIALVAGDIPSGAVAQVTYDGTQFQLTSNIIAPAPTTDYLNTTRIDVASAATVNLTSSAPNTRHINITGITTITAFTVAVGQCYFVRFNAALTLTNNANIVTQTGANITTAAGDTCIIRTTAANVVEVLSFKSGTTQKNECTAWVNFNGTGTVAIRDSFNVSSITDIGVGSYDVNFTVAMSNANYSAVVLAGAESSVQSAATGGSSWSGGIATPWRTSAFRAGAFIAGAISDLAQINVQILGGK